MKDTLKRRLQTNVIATFAGLAMAGALAVTAAYLIGFSARTDDIQVVIHEIQESRAESVRMACRDQNERHDDVIGRVDRLILARLTGRPGSPDTTSTEVVRRIANAVRKDPEARGKRLLESRKSTVFLIEGLAPRRSCAKRVRDLVGAPPD